MTKVKSNKFIFENQIRSTIIASSIVGLYDTHTHGTFVYYDKAPNEIYTYPSVVKGII